MEKCNIILSGLDPLSVKYGFNKNLIRIYKSFPDMFYSDIVIAGIYGNFSVAKHATVETNSPHNRTSIGAIHDVRDYIKKNNMFTIIDAGSAQITERSVYDFYDNCVYEVFNQDGNSVIVHDERLAKLMHREYQHYGFVSGPDEMFTVDETVSRLNNQELVFVNPSLDYTLLDECDCSFAIMLINPWCHHWCNKYYQHHSSVQQTLYNYHNEAELRVPTNQLPNRWPGSNLCPNAKQSILAKMENTKFLTHDAMLQYAVKGVRFFAFENFVFESVYNMVKTASLCLVKPECQDKFEYLMYTSMDGGVN